MVKKSFILFVLMIFLIWTVSAQSINIELTSSELEAGEDLILIATIYDNQNSPIDGEISVIIEDAEKTEQIEKTINSKELSKINLSENAIQGQWQITAKHNEIESTEFFFIKAKEEVTFSLEEDVLKVVNTGNVIYTPKITIKIGDTEGEIKNPRLEIKEELTYRLIAPEGTYEISVTDGKTTFSEKNVALKNAGLTGEIIGAIDESSSKRSSLTGGISPSEDSDEALLSYMKNSKFVYVFILAVFGITILLAIERRYRKKSGK